ncbi:hypothetical protein X975_11794, partial [Stegodyphus mimosarum]
PSQITKFKPSSHFKNKFGRQLQFMNHLKYS